MTTEQESEFQLVQEFVTRGQLEKAWSFYKRYRDKYPDDSNTLFLEAQLLWEEDKNHEAQKTITLALSRDPENILYSLLHAEILTSLKKFSDAEKEFLKILGKQPDNVDVFASYSNLLLLAGQVTKAQEILSWILKVDPTHFGALLNLTFCRIINGQLDVDSIELRKLLENYPDSIGSLIPLSYALSEKGRYHEALLLAQQVFRMEPSKSELRDWVIELKVMTHPLMVPYRFSKLRGPAGPAIAWLSAVAVFSLALWIGSITLILSLALGYFIYGVGSWTIEPFLRKWYSKRGFS